MKSYKWLFWKIECTVNILLISTGGVFFVLSILLTVKNEQMNKN